MTIKVVLADDHPVVRSGIKNELSQSVDIEVVGEAANGDEALRLARELQPDVLLLDINMPGQKAVRVIRELQAQTTEPRILILTAYSDVENVVGMLKAGATGYLLKDENPSVIADGVRAVAQGTLWLSAAVAASLVGQATGEHPLAENDTLSDRELDVLRLMAQGCSNGQIAEALAISEGTVKNHVTHLYDHLGVRSRAEAVVWAWQHGVVQAS
ncbi:MAG: response regulator transcription factor [Anaerolineales bacterium]|nr:response regulator transcription factor [Anaerolineales bacterium]